MCTYIYMKYEQPTWMLVLISQPVAREVAWELRVYHYSLRGHKFASQHLHHAGHNASNSTLKYQHPLLDFERLYAHMHRDTNK